MANYLPVSSNDTLSHLSLSGSPETLCGKIVVDEHQPRDESVEQTKNPNTNWLVQRLVCDICETLSRAGSFIKENTRTVEAGRDCPFCEDGTDSSGLPCVHCGGSGWLTEGDLDSWTDLGIPDDLDLDNLKGTKVAADLYDTDLRLTDYLPKLAVELPRGRKDEEGNVGRPGQWSEPGQDDPTTSEGHESEENVGQSAQMRAPAAKTRGPVPYNAESNPSTPPGKGPHFGAVSCPACGYLKQNKKCASCGFNGEEAGRVVLNEGPQERFRVEQTEAGPKVAATPHGHDPRIFNDQELMLNHLADEHGRDVSNNVGRGYASYAFDLHDAMTREADEVAGRPKVAIKRDHECPTCEGEGEVYNSAGNSRLCGQCGGEGYLKGHPLDFTCDRCGRPGNNAHIAVPGWEGKDICDTCVQDFPSLEDRIIALDDRGLHLPPTESKVATNWTRDGLPIEDGFTVVISTEEAARIPFLDFSRVAVSDRRECPDCREAKWLQAIASCEGCGQMKCKSCMEVVGIDSFLGTCKKCASANSDLAYEVAYEDAMPDQDRFLSFLMRDEGEDDFNTLFLPNDEL